MIASDLAYPYVGGGESYVIQLSKALIELGQDVHWVTSRIAGTKKYEKFEGIDIHRVPILFSKHYLFPGRHMFPLTGIPFVSNIAKKMDVLQFNTFVAGSFGTIVSKLSGRPTLLFCHEFFNDLWKVIGRNLFEQTIYPIIEKFMAHLDYDWFACPSEFSKRSLIVAGAPKHKITVIPHGINFELFNPKVKTGLKKQHKLDKYKLYGFTGRLSVKGAGHSKNLIGLLEAAKIIEKEVSDSKLVLGGSFFDELKPMIKKMGLENHVIYVGERAYNKVPELIATYDVVVCPAFSDGFCFLLAEASAIGKPLVATNVGSHPERIIHNKTGLISGIHPEELADNIIKLLTNKKVSKRLGKNSAKFAKSFTWKKSAKKHLEIYQRLVK